MSERTPDAAEAGSSPDSASEHNPSESVDPKVATETGVLAGLGLAIEVAVSGAALVYALGYLTWAFVLWEHDIGFPPALEGQYLIAGLVPAAILGLVVLLVAGLLRLLVLIRKDATEFRIRSAKRLQGLATVRSLGGFVCLAVLSDSTAGGLLIVTGMLGFVGSWMFATSRLDRWAARGTIWYLIVASPFLCFVPLQWYATRLSVHLPAEFGGPVIKRVRLDIAPAEFSAETLSLFGIQPASGADTLRTGPLRVMMVPGDLLVVMAGDGTKPVPVRIRSDLVRAIIPDR